MKMFFKLQPKKASDTSQKSLKAFAKPKSVVMPHFGPRVTHALLKAEKKKMKQED